LWRKGRKQFTAHHITPVIAVIACLQNEFPDVAFVLAMVCATSAPGRNGNGLGKINQYIHLFPCWLSLIAASQNVFGSHRSRHRQLRPLPELWRPASS